MLATATFHHRGFGVVLELLKIDYGSHYVTCWGYKCDDRNNYVGVYLTDSDDTSQQGLKCYEVAQNGEFPSWWHLQNNYGVEGYFIAHALDRLRISPSAPENLLIHPY